MVTEHPAHVRTWPAMLSGSAEPNGITKLCHTCSTLSKTHGSSKKYEAKRRRPEFPLKGQQTAWRQPSMELQTNISFDQSVGAALNPSGCRVKRGPVTDATSDFFLPPLESPFSTSEYQTPDRTKVTLVMGCDWSTKTGVTIS
jgi:hypothetical protein